MTKSPAPIGPELPTEGSEPGSIWTQPTIWIVLGPFVTVPFTWVLTGQLIRTSACNRSFFFGVEAECQVDLVLLVLAPGLLNLVPALWLMSHNSKTRLVATIGTILGAIRLAFPAVALLVTARAAPPILNLSCSGRCTHISSSVFYPAFPNGGTDLSNLSVPVISAILYLYLLALIAVIHVVGREP